MTREKASMTDNELLTCYLQTKYGSAEEFSQGELDVIKESLGFQIFASSARLETALNEANLARKKFSASVDDLGNGLNLLANTSAKLTRDHGTMPYKIKQFVEVLMQKRRSGE